MNPNFHKFYSRRKNTHPTGKVKIQEIIQQIYTASFPTQSIRFHLSTLHDIFLDRVEKTVSSIARPIEEQDQHELGFSLCVIRFEGSEKGFCLVEIQGKEGVCKDRSAFRYLEETDESADGEPKVALVSNSKDFPQNYKGFAVAIREIDHLLGFFRVLDLFLCVWFGGFEHPLWAVMHDQGKRDHRVDGIDPEASQEEPILVCDKICQTHGR